MKIIYFALAGWLTFTTVYTVAGVSNSIASFAQSLAAPQIHGLN